MHFASVFGIKHHPQKKECHSWMAFGRGVLGFRLLWFSGVTHRLLSSSFLGLPDRILNINHKKELIKKEPMGRVRLSG